MKPIDFTLCISVYAKDNPALFREAVDCILARQTVMPSEVVLVVDGPIPEELNTIVKTYERQTHFVVIRLPQNKGHAFARQTALEHASNEWVAIMDSDDVALPDRFAKQIAFLQLHPEVDIVGGQIEEFIGEPGNVVGKREVPLNDDAIKRYLKSRCPFNQVTVMFRKEAAQKAGGYRDWYCDEDYYLWIRMALAGCRFANLPDVLVNVRVGKDMYRRRGGWRYFKSEARLQVFMWRKGLIAFPRLAVNVGVRFLVQVIMPNGVRSWVFQHFARKKS